MKMYEFRNGKKEFTKEFLEHLKEEVRKEREEKMCEEDYLAWAGLSSSRDFFEVQYKFETSEDVKKFIKGQIEFTSTCMYALDCKYEHDINKGIIKNNLTILLYLPNMLLTFYLF